MMRQVAASVWRHEYADVEDSGGNLLVRRSSSRTSLEIRTVLDKTDLYIGTGACAQMITLHMVGLCENLQIGNNGHYKNDGNDSKMPATHPTCKG